MAEAAGKLKLTDITVLPARAEAVGRGPMRASFDVVTARAVAALPVLLEQMPKEPPEQKPRGQWNPQQVQPECWPKPKAELLPAGAYP